MTVTIHPQLVPAKVSGKEALYAIASDGDRLEVERSRLNLLHKTIANTFDNKLIFAPVALTQGDRVLDCGTGTGIWPNEVARIVPPGVHVEGADISPRFSPLPGQISAFTFHALSTLDLPFEWENRFQLVNQRLMLGSFSRPQWETVIQNIYRVVKPGGWVQLVEIQQEYDFSATHPKYQRGLNLVDEKARVLIRHRIRSRRYVTTRRVQQHHTNSKSRAYRGMREATVQMGCVESGEEFDRLLTEGFDEVNEIPGLEHDMEIIRAQKLD
ncbi:S-adenosyl-L-methionine-dependent methyltransferase [Pluteus cervinus]|uniref:S-adenosyl-L-methionine-dependent methyltransferase n=1 Tax=Pluteus cervinus TaxID=181527 RepID=A0ACD3AH27_9AGAR|nr:S-adenosyl-L-methionine-dependent methyltransferase [Pluteus cervinus]